jgi:hypothetical protein
MVVGPYYDYGDEVYARCSLDDKWELLRFSYYLKHQSTNEWFAAMIGSIKDYRYIITKEEFNALDENMEAIKVLGKYYKVPKKYMGDINDSIGVILEGELEISRNEYIVFQARKGN